MQNSNSYKIIGLFFMICALLFSVFLWFMNSKFISNEDLQTYYINTNSLPQGIKKDSLVKFIGVNAGFVRNIYFGDVKNAIITIEIGVKKDLPIKVDSVAVVKTQGFAGVAFIDISKGGENSALLTGKKRFISIKPATLDKIGLEAEILAQNLNKTLKNIDNILHGNKSLKSLTVSLDKILLNISSDENIKNLNQIVRNVAQISQNLAISSSKINPILDKISQISSKMDKFSDKANYLAPEFSQTMNDLQDAIKEFRNTLLRLEDNPYEFFFKDTKD